ncbi:MAG: DEAD/DEAH box helicase [Pedobacter sp.]|uniref:DEAD/DEAH box helicase n=1 Tax=Pedobacter sp. TaxID=1411316 RepID=UPI00280A4A8E|nr:DEAD/DEAH box helicase [Pedobacter sp.]MDQ8004006.1 DEAD/DEAH box helicase [Pedobacter sp.]
MELQKLLSNLNIKNLNPLQEEVSAKAKTSTDLVVLAPTGSGKTLAFLIPVLRNLNKQSKGVQCLILVPSRELGLQIEQVFKQMSTGFKVTCCYGGHSVKVERNTLIEAPAVLIGTPGRIAFHLREQNFDESTITTLILDEFDKSLEFGFTEDMSFIIGSLYSLKQRMLTSATAMQEIPDFTGIRNQLEINFLSQQEILPDLKLKRINTLAEEKLETLFKLICKIGDHSMLIFCNHRETVDRISDLLIDQDLVHDIFHGGMEQDDRERALLKFRNGSVKILITTDLAARGLDIPEVEYIIHYQLPYTKDAFVHRNGRTARMNAKGTAYLIFAEDEKFPYLDDHIDIEHLDGEYQIPPDSEWQTIYLAAGKKDKINKIDIVGFLLKVGGLAKEDLGLIEVKDLSAYAAVKRKFAPQLINKLSGQKIKGRKIKVEIAN